MTATIEINELKNKLEAKYQRNIEFFKQHLPSIYNKIINNPESPAITIDSETGIIHRTISDNSQFHDDPVSLAMKEVKEFMTKVKNSNYAPEKWQAILKHMIKKGAFKKSSKFYDSNKDETSSETTTRLDVVVFGVGLGHHIEMLAKIGRAHV